MVENSDVSATTDSVQSGRKRYVVGLVIVTLLAALLIAAAVYYQKTTSLGDPLFSNVKESDIIAARVLSGKRAAQGIEPTMVDVPPRLAFELLSTLTPNHKDPRPAEWQVLGALEFEVGLGKSYSVRLYRTSEQKEAAFSINRVYYRGGSNDRLVELMQEAEELFGEKNGGSP